ncbi:MAG TPA: hypothetical protein VGM63_13825, partial [Mucilaginibacter sp.]
MNYIRHLNGFFARIQNDKRVGPLHVSLYMALFQHWNHHRFETVFPVCRPVIMRLSKIGSKNTYYKCMKELHYAGYIRYYPSLYRHLPVKVTIHRLDLDDGSGSEIQIKLFDEGEDKKQRPKKGTKQVPVLTAGSPTSGTAMVPKVGQYIKHTNNINSVLNTPTHDIEEKWEAEKNKNNAATGSKEVP